MQANLPAAAVAALSSGSHTVYVRGQDANGNPIGYGICSVSGHSFSANDVGFGALAMLGFVGFGVLRRRRR